MGINEPTSKIGCFKIGCRATEKASLLGTIFLLLLRALLHLCLNVSLHTKDLLIKRSKQQTEQQRQHYYHTMMSCSSNNSIFRAPSTSYDGPLLPKTTSTSSTASSTQELYERARCHFRTHSKEYDSFVPALLNDEEEDDDDIILEQSPATVILPADNQLLSAWTFFAARFSSKSEFQDY